jgi:hypothetical protein
MAAPDIPPCLVLLGHAFPARNETLDSQYKKYQPSEFLCEKSCKLLATPACVKFPNVSTVLHEDSPRSVPPSGGELLRQAWILEQTQMVRASIWVLHRNTSDVQRLSDLMNVDLDFTYIVTHTSRKR